MFRKLNSVFVFLSIVFFYGCAATPKSIVEGRYFHAFFDHYDTSIPLEEHCALLILDRSRQFAITEINGKKAYRYGNFSHRGITVLPPGNYIFTISEIVSPVGGPPGNGSGSHSGAIYGYTTITMTLQAGRYYFFTPEYGMLIDDIENYSEIEVSDVLTLSKPISKEDIMEGINASIAREKKNY
jgi:hypothetical protein